MKTVHPLALIACLISAVQPARAAQESRPPGWLARSIDKEAARLAAAAPLPEAATIGRSDDHPSKWARVVALKPGFLMLVELRGVPPVSRRFVWADAAELIVLNLDHPHLSDAERRTLRDATTTHPENFRRLNEGFRFVYDNVRVAPDGIFAGNRKIAETGDVVQRIPRGEVAAVMTPPYRRGSILGAVGGAMAGGVIGYRLAPRVMNMRKNGTAWLALCFVGLPFGGALLGSRVETGVTQRVIYRAP